MTVDGETVRLEVTERIGRVRLARPAAGNVLDRATTVSLRNAVRRHDADGRVQVIVLSGDGADFCAGYDLDTLAALPAGDSAAHLEEVQSFARLALTLRSAMKPVIVGVQGRCFGAGLALALAGDIVVASADARFGVPDGRAGLLPPAAALLVRATGEKRALDLALTGRVLDADGAVAAGLASRVCAVGTLERTVEAVAADLLAAPELSAALTRRLLHHVADLELREGVAAGVKTELEARLRASPSGTAGLAARARAGTDT